MIRRGKAPLYLKSLYYMARTYTLICILAVVFVPACRRPHPNFWNGKTLNYPANIACEKLVLEELDLDPINCSFDGLSGIFSNRHIYYLDKYFGYMYKFDEQGRFLK